MDTETVNANDNENYFSMPSPIVNYSKMKNKKHSKYTAFDEVPSAMMVQSYYEHERSSTLSDDIKSFVQLLKSTSDSIKLEAISALLEIISSNDLSSLGKFSTEMLQSYIVMKIALTHDKDTILKLLLPLILFLFIAYYCINTLKDAVPYLTQSLKDRNHVVCEMSAKCLSIIVSTSREMRDFLLDYGLLASL